MADVETLNTYKCPECGSEDVRVLATVSCLPTPLGVEVTGDIVRDVDDDALCNDCDWGGKMGDLVLSPAKED